MNADGLRCDLPAGPITRGQLYELMPFGGRLKRGTILGRTILKALERSVSARSVDNERQSPFLQVSGMTFKYDSSRPAGARLMDVKVQGRPLDPNRTYRVALEDYLADGKLNYTTFEEDGEFHETGVSVLDSIEEHMRDGLNLMALSRWRVHDLTPEAES